MAFGTSEYVAEEARQCITNMALGGGFFLTTSNCIYKGVPPINAVTLSKIGQKYGKYKLR